MKKFDYKGFFISLEGIDGAGKSHQTALLAEYLKENFTLDVITTKEPGGSFIGSAVRQLLLDNRDLSPQTIAFLVMADRYEHVHKNILPNLNQGKIVISDRYLDSTFAYQGEAVGVDLSWLEKWSADNLPLPDLTFWLDIPTKDAVKRINKRNKNMHQLNAVFEEEQFLNKVLKAYENLFNRHRPRIEKVDAGLTASAVNKKIVSLLTKHAYFKKISAKVILP